MEGEAQSDSIMPFLIYSLKNGDNDYATRSQTIDIVKPYVQEKSIRDVLIYVMKTDKSPAMRMKTLTVLSKAARIQEVKEAILDRLKNDENEGVRFRALKIIEEIIDAQTLSALAKVKEHDQNKVIRDRANFVYKKYSAKL